MIEASSLWGLVAARAAASPAEVMAIDEHDRELTFGDLAGRAERAAAGLRARGITAGDVVSWQLPNRLEALVLVAALARLDTIQNPLVAMLRHRELGFICGQAGSRLLVVPPAFRGFDHAALAAAVAAEIPGLDVLVIDGLDDLPEGDPATLPPAALPTTPVGPAPDHLPVRWYAYTSGTTADPKGARHTDAALMAASRNTVAALRITEADRLTLLAPVAHIGGLSHVVTSLRTGCRLLVGQSLHPTETPRFLRRHGVTLAGSGVPFINAYLAYQRAHPEDAPLFPQVRVFMCGGSPRPKSLNDEVKTVLGGIGVVSGFGLTECPMFTWTSVTDGDAERATTEGRAPEGAEIRLVDGEVRLRGPQLMLGYVDAALDADAFDADGFFRTGDLGTIDDRGYLTITGRLKDVIIRNMENISAREVEDGLLTHPAVAEVAVVGLPDDLTGEQVCAAVVAADAGSPPRLDQLCEHLLAAGLNKRKLPERLHVVASLPRNAMGKVLKTDLRRTLLAERAGTGHESNRPLSAERIAP